MHSQRTKHVFLLVTAIGIFSGSLAFSSEKYRVATGDNLYRIGKKFGVSYHDIMKVNQLRNTVIYPDQILIIPTEAKEPNTVARRAPAPPAPVTASPRQSANEDPLGIGYRPGNHSAGGGQAHVPNDPVQPFASARKLPEAPPVKTEEDPLGIGYRPSPYKTVPKREPSRSIAQTTPTVPPHSYPGQKHRPHQVPVQNFPRSREVPAVAQSPRINSSAFKIETEFRFPTPSFKNPCEPTRNVRSVSSCTTYLVKSGDSVWGISRKHGISPFKLRKANNILFSRIHPGMKLIIPN